LETAKHQNQLVEREEVHHSIVIEVLLLIPFALSEAFSPFSLASLARFLGISCFFYLHRLRDYVNDYLLLNQTSIAHLRDELVATEHLVPSISYLLLDLICILKRRITQLERVRS
jgi:hypothetical protein